MTSSLRPPTENSRLFSTELPSRQTMQLDDLVNRANEIGRKDQENITEFNEIKSAFSNLKNTATFWDGNLKQQTETLYERVVSLLKKRKQENETRALLRKDFSYYMAKKFDPVNPDNRQKNVEKYIKDGDDLDKFERTNCYCCRLSKIQALHADLDMANCSPTLYKWCQ